MARYSLYRSNTRCLIKGFAYVGMKPNKKMGRDGMLKMVDDYYIQSSIMTGANVGEAITSCSGRILLAERGWMLEEDRKTVFIESKELVSDLLSAKVIQQGMTPPEQPISFAVALPVGTTSHGIELKPFLVVIGRTQDVVDRQCRLGAKIWNMPLQAGREPNPDAFCVLLCCEALDIPESLQGAPAGFIPYLSLLLHEDRINELLKADVESWYESPLESIGDIHRMLNTDCTPRESVMQLLLMRLAIALWVYWQACPEAIKDGMPSPFQDADAPALGKLKGMLVTSPSGAQGERMVSEHYRRWHFRQLRSQRYYKGEHADAAPGSRWVLVRDTTVNRDPGEDLTAVKLQAK